MSTELKPADVFLTRGTSLISRTIRFFTRRIGESRTKVNHVGVVVAGGPIREAMIVEALSRVRRHNLWDAYGDSDKNEVAIYRPKNLTDDEVRAVVAATNDYVDQKYGYLKIAAHVADWALFGAYVFRRLARMDKYPICSWLVAHAFAKADQHFGVKPGAATPDDIWDFIVTHPNIYEEIHPLQPLSDVLPSSSPEEG